MRFGLSVALCAAIACGSTGKDTPRTDSTGLTRSTDPAADTAPSDSTTPVDARRGEVLIIGTSLTAGLGLDDPNDYYPSVLQRMADSLGYRVAFQNAGLSGETSAGALRRIEWLLRTPYDVVVIETGANDGLRGLDIDSTRANLVAIVRGIRARLPQATIALIQMEAPPNLGVTYTRRFRESFQVVAEQERIALLPFLLDGVAGVTALNQRDGIHPNPEGARRVATNVWKGLEPLFRAWRG
jgi:acyl-CoA thioesterase-1